MDYGSLLQLAKKNSEKKEVKRALPSLPPARTAEELRQKELEKKRVLDANIAKFLAKRQDDEKKKQTDANKKRGELLALRNQDSKARKRVLLMNKSAKSADKSAIQDAVGPSDYYIIEEPLCFMSQEALAQETKFLEKLCNGPTEEKFSKSKSNTNRDLSGTKDRVKLALKMGDTLDKIKSRETKDKSKETKREETKVEEYKKPKEEIRHKKQKAPPPMNYYELLKLAEKLQQEPVKEAPKEKEIETRPMTAKQREEYLCEEASRKRKEAGWREEERLKKMGKMPSFKIPSAAQGRIPKVSSTPAPSSSLPRIPKLNSSASKQDNHDRPSSSSNKKTSQAEDRPTASSSMLRSHLSEKPSKPKQSEDYKDKEPLKQNGKNTNKSHASQASPSRSSNDRKTVSSSLTSRAENKPSSKSTLQQTSRPSSRDDVSKPKPLPLKKLAGNDCKVARSLSPSGVRLKKVPPEDLKSRPGNLTSRPFPPSDLKSRQASVDGKGRPATATNEKPRQYLPSDLRSKQAPSTDAKPRLLTNDKSKQSSLNNDKSRQTPSVSVKSRPSLPADVKSRQFPPADVKSRQFPPSDVKPKQFPPSDVKSRQFPPPDVKSRQFPPSDVKPRQFPPSDVKSKQFPPADVRRRPQKPAQKRRIIESDEEFDSEDEDFIDDGPDENGQDYSKYIQEIFGYDKSRYRDMDDDDDRCMESSFAQQQKEEFTSTKLGIMEDLEDIRKEKEREARIKQRKKARKL